MGYNPYTISKKLNFTTLMKTITHPLQFVYLLLATIAFFSCDEQVSKAQEQNTPGSYSNFYTYEYDSCEYVGNNLINSNAIFVHKGNCRFCAERSKN